jgi:ABC-type Fe3+ transport system permease subunit
MPVLAVCMVVPYLGTIIHTLWGTWLAIIQSTEVHGRTKPTATMVFGILAALMVFTGLSAEYASRQAMEQAEEYLQGLSEAQSNALENLENMGKAVGEFMKGLQEAAKQSEEAQ